jgi:tripartite-type tricarboxylate transporter receptor subunit TctC
MIAGAAAETYPEKPIKLVVGFGPGGPADVMARLVAAGISPILGQTVFVDNRPGAGGMLGAEAVAEAEPDGYTLLLGNTANLIISPLLYKEVHYDPAEAFAPVANLGITPNILIVNKASGLKSVQDIVNFARTNPGKLNYASAGIGTPLHLIGEMFKQRLGLDIVHVPYKSGGQATQAVMTGETQLCFDSAEAALPAVENGSVVGLAVTSDKRIPQMANLPTMIEAGVPDFVSVSFTGIVAPARTPADIVNRLNAAIGQALTSDKVHAVLNHLAVQSEPQSPDEFAGFLDKQRAQWSAVIKRAIIHIDE